MIKKFREHRKIGGIILWLISPLMLFEIIPAFFEGRYFLVFFYSVMMLWMIALGFMYYADEKYV